YTRVLLDSVPSPDSPDGFAGPALEGDVPSPLSPPSGCRFRTRCPRASGLCAEREPEIRQVESGQHVACHFPLEPAIPAASPITSAEPSADSPPAAPSIRIDKEGTWELERGGFSRRWPQWPCSRLRRPPR